MAFDREAAKAAGYSDDEIDEFVAARSQAGTPESRVSGGGSGVNPWVAAAGGAALVGAGAGGVALARNPKARKLIRPMARYAGRQVPGVGPVMDAMDLANDVRGAMRTDPATPPGAPPSVARPPAAPKPSASIAYVTEADIKALPQLKHYQPGQEIRRATLERYRETEAAPAPPKRTQAKIVPLPKKRTVKPPDTVPIRVQEKPKAVRGTKQRGVTKREIASRQQGMAESRVTTPAASGFDDDMMAQLEQQLAYEQAATKQGIGVGGGARKLMRTGLRGMGSKLPGALGVLMMLNDARTMPQQIDEAGREVRRAMDPRLAEYLEDLQYTEGI